MIKNDPRDALLAASALVAAPALLWAAVASADSQPATEATQTEPTVLVDEISEGVRTRLSAGEITGADGSVIRYFSQTVMRCAGETGTTLATDMLVISDNPERPVIADSENQLLARQCQDGQFTAADRNL